VPKQPLDQDQASRKVVLERPSVMS
jgi:hypothetical protein